MHSSPIRVGRPRLFLVPLILLVTVLPAPAPAVPANDSCGNPTPIGNGVYTGTTTGATNDGSATCGSSNSSPDVWYTYYAPCTGTLLLDTCDSSYDTVLSVYSSCPGEEPMSELVCNDDCATFPFPCEGTVQSCVAVAASAGTTYLIRVSGYNGASGDFLLKVDLNASPANDTCLFPTVFPGSVGVVPVTYQQSTTCATAGELVPNCGLNGNGSDVWYVFVPEETCTYRIHTFGSSYDTVLQVYQGLCGSLVPVSGGCSDDCQAPERWSCLSLELPVGANYWFQVGHYNNGGGGTLSLSLSKLDTDNDGTPDCTDGCPNDPNKTSPGQCGCGVPDTDSDGDGVADCIDVCPGFDDNADADGDSVPDGCDPCPYDATNDGDGDGVCEDVDNCPGVYNPTQSNADADGYGDACDPCPNDATNDGDGDGVCEDVDNCPGVYNPTQSNADGDSAGDACDACPNEPALVNPSEPGGEVTCNDGIDNDCDGATDMSDSDCTFTDCNNNGIDDATDIAKGTSQDCQPNGIPDECEPDCDGDDTPDDCEPLVGLVEIHWVGTTGAWNDAQNWCPPVVPDNGGGVTYRVMIHEPLSVVNLSSFSPTISEMEVFNGAVLQVSGNPTLQVLGTLTIADDGLYRPDPDRTEATSATLTAGYLLITKGVGPGGVILEDTMMVNAENCTVDGASACCGCPLRGGSLPPRLRIRSSRFVPELLRGRGITLPVGALNVTGLLHFIGEVDVLVSDVAHVTLGGNFGNQSVGASCFDWGAGTLHMSGTSPQTFQLAGEDFGADQAGFVDNFAMGTIEILPGADVEFVDDFDNEPSGGCEALYVNSLNLGSGSTVRLAGCNLYYNGLLDEGATINDSAGGEILQVACPNPCGDINGDGAIGLADFVVFAGCFEQSPEISQDCQCSDMNGDQAIGLADFVIFAGLFGATPGTLTPPDCQ